MFPADLRVFATCPESRTVARHEYPEQLARVARWGEAAGLDGLLIYVENGLVDPWLVAQLLVQATERLSPLVAVQPVYMHPYAVAKMVASFAHLHSRRLHLNLVAGGFRNDLAALGDETPHDERYARLAVYGGIVKSLIAGTSPVTTVDGRYNVKHLRLAPSVPEELRPGLMVSGSSAAGMRAAQALGATAVKYPRQVGEEEPALRGQPTGVRLGIIARPDAEAAWLAALERFPEDRAGQLTHQLAMSVSDSHWHRQLCDLAADRASTGQPYWLGPFQNYRTFCPYLVGSYSLVGAELAAYIRRGFGTFILDIPPAFEELEHAAAAFAHAMQVVAASGLAA